MSVFASVLSKAWRVWSARSPTLWVRSCPTPAPTAGLTCRDDAHFAPNTPVPHVFSHVLNGNALRLFRGLMDSCLGVFHGVRHTDNVETGIHVQDFAGATLSEVGQEIQRRSRDPNRVGVFA